MTPAVESQLLTSDSHPSSTAFKIFIVYLFLIFFAPQERYSWIATLRPAFSVAILTVACHILSRRNPRDSHSLKTPLQGYLLILLFFIFMFSSILSPLPHASLPSTLMSFLKLTIIFLVTFTIVRTDHELSTIIHAIMIFGAIIAFYTLFAYRFGWHQASYRMTSCFGGMGSNSNGFAMFLLALLPFFIIYFNAESHRLWKIAYALIVLCLLLCIVKTRSRMGFLGILVQFILILWYVRKSKKALFAALLLFCLPLLHASDNLWKRVGTIHMAFSQTNVDDPGRTNKWRQAATLIRRYPVLGVGQSRFRDAVRYHGLGESEHIVHNAYLEIACESGVMSMLMFISCLIITIRQNLVAIKFFDHSHDKRMRKVSKGLFISLTTYAFCLLFLSEHYNSMLYIMLALSASLSRIARIRDDGSRGFAP